MVLRRDNRMVGRWSRRVLGGGCGWREGGVVDGRRMLWRRGRERAVEYWEVRGKRPP